MRTNFKILADKFSTLNGQDNKDFISFYRNNKNEIEDLKVFETEEELYLSAVIHHTYGRSLLYETKDYRTAEMHLDIARSLIVNNRTKFNLELTEDIWYLQTLQHLLTISIASKSYSKSKELLRELKRIDSENENEYQLEEKKIDRIKRYRIFMILTYCGMGLIVAAMIYRSLTSTSMGMIDRVGELVGLIGIIGVYLNRDTVKKHSPQHCV
jgi:hypothetical protein